MPAASKEELREILSKLEKKANLSAEELQKLQQHIDVLEQATAGSHHHDSKAF